MGRLWFLRPGRQGLQGVHLLTNKDQAAPLEALLEGLGGPQINLSPLGYFVYFGSS